MYLRGIYYYFNVCCDAYKRIKIINIIFISIIPRNLSQNNTIRFFFFFLKGDAVDSCGKIIVIYSY